MTRVEVIDSLHAFDKLRDPWNDLARRDGPPLPYVRHEWLGAWWTGFGAGASLAIHVAWDGERLTAAAPFMRSRRSLAGIPVTALHSLGMNVGFADVLRDPSRPDDLGLVLEAALSDPNSDLVLTRGTPAAGEKAAWIRQWIVGRRILCETIVRGEFYLDGSGGVEAYRSARPRRLRNESIKRTRELAERGPVRFDRVRGAGPWETALEEAFQISLRSWKAREGSAIGQHPGFRVFLAELARRFGASDEAEICLLRVNGTAIAFRMGVSDRDMFVDHEIAFDEAWREYTPGNLVALHLDTALIQQGIREINLGFDFAWKESWAPIRRERLDWILYRRDRPMARAAWLARSVRARFLGKGATG